MAQEIRVSSGEEGHVNPAVVTKETLVTLQRDPHLAIENNQRTGIAQLDDRHIPAAARDPPTQIT